MAQTYSHYVDLTSVLDLFERQVSDVAYRFSQGILKSNLFLRLF